MTSEKIRVDSSGTYWVLVSDSNLCNSSDSIHVEFKKEGGEINVPNVFSPNGDLINDLLEVNVDFVEDYLLQIYTRWGQKVLETSQVTEFWDGGDLPEGTYYYIVKYLDQCNGISKLKKGSVTLLR
jgi:gliding motility-associated-like protein